MSQDQTPVEIVAIIDRSGSMREIQADAIGGFNAFLEKQKQLPGEAVLTLALFDHEYLTPVTAAPLQTVEPLTDQTFVPRGTTALYDAIGRTLTDLLARSPQRAIVVILTDGAENASREFNRAQAKDLINRAQDKGYQVLYLAANQDAFQTGAQIGVLQSATMNFDYTGAGVRSVMRTATASAADYRAGGTGEIKPEDESRRRGE